MAPRRTSPGDRSDLPKAYWGALPERVCRDPGFHARVRVLVAIANRDQLWGINGSTQGCWAAVDAIAEQCQLHRSTVYEAIEWLIEHQYLSRNVVQVGDGKRVFHHVIYPVKGADSVAETIPSVAEPPANSRQQKNEAVDAIEEAGTEYTQTRFNNNKGKECCGEPEGDSSTNADKTEQLLDRFDSMSEAKCRDLTEDQLRRMLFRAEPGSEVARRLGCVLKAKAGGV